jgi:hypothetical protein
VNLCTDLLIVSEMVSSLKFLIVCLKAQNHSRQSDSRRLILTYCILCSFDNRGLHTLKMLSRIYSNCTLGSVFIIQHTPLLTFTPLIPFFFLVAAFYLLFYFVYIETIVA